MFFFFLNSFVHRIQQAGEGIFAREQLMESPAANEELSPAKRHRKEDQHTVEMERATFRQNRRFQINIQQR